MNAPILRRIALVSFLSIAAACESSSPRPATMLDAIGTWQLDAAIPAGGRIPTMTIGKDGSVHGNGGVNRYSSSVDVAALKNGSWRMGPAQLTRMAGPEDAMALEQAMLDAMRQADGARMEGDKLALLQGERALLRFSRPRF